MDKRKEILRLLKNFKGEWASGQKIANALGISRNGVSKHVKILRNMNYIIEASTKKGYMYLEETKDLNKYEIELSENERTIGNKAHMYKEVKSTNKRAQMIDILHEDTEGNVIVAENQSAARGRKATLWPTFANQGAYFSIILHPDCDVDEVPGLILAASYSLCKSISERYEIENVKINWPNSITVDNKKIGGILAENVTDLEKVKTTVLGVGLYTTFDADNEAAKDLTCISDFVDERIDRNQVISNFLDVFDEEYILFRSKKNIEASLEKWSTCLNIIGKDITLAPDGLKGKIIGMNEHFNMIFEKTDGEKISLKYGDIELQ